MDGNGNPSTIFSTVEGMIYGVVIFNFDQVSTTGNANETGNGSISCKVRC